MIRGRQVNRPTPLMPSQAYKTYSIQQPLSTHFRPATCEEVGCLAYNNGWFLRVDTLPPELDHTARTSGRRYRVLVITKEDSDSRKAANMPELDPGTYLIFEAGQDCFESRLHKTSLERPELFIVGRGDWRTFSPRKATRHKTPEDWVEDMSIHLDRIQREIAKG